MYDIKCHKLKKQVMIWNRYSLHAKDLGQENKTNPDKSIILKKINNKMKNHEQRLERKKAE